MKKYSSHKINNSFIPSVPSRIRVLGNELSSLIPFSSQFSSFFPHFRDFPEEIQPALVNKSWNRAPERVVKISSLENRRSVIFGRSRKKGPNPLCRFAIPAAPGLSVNLEAHDLDIELQCSLESLERFLRIRMT